MKKCSILFLAIVFLLGGCSFFGQKHENRPYEPDTPAPGAHNGVFLSEHGTMTFNGDGESIVIDFDEELAKLTGLPAGEQTGTYEFLSGDLPPHGSVPVRYDAAHEMQITAGGQSVAVDMGIASDDGKTGQTGVNVVTPERIPMLFDEDRFFSIVFLKEKTKSDGLGIESDGTIRYFLFTESNGGDPDSRTSYKLEYEDGTYTAEIKPESVPHDETLTVNVDADFADRLKAVITENNAWSWDGYDEAADVLDGIGFTLRVETSDGSGIKAVGYMEWPPNFNNTASGFHKLFLEVYEKNKSALHHKEDDLSVAHFFFSEAYGSDFYDWTEYRLDCEDGVYTVSIKPDHVAEEDGLTVNVDADFADRLMAVITENDVKSWDGFDERDSDVMDGIGFTMHVIMSDGSRIDANGYMEWPPNHGEVFHKFNDLFREVYEENS